MLKNKGFSLIELLIVIAIVAILAAIAYPSYTSFIEDSKRSRVQQFMLEVASRQEQYFMDARQYFATADMAGLGLNEPQAVDNQYDVTVVPDNGATPPTYTITATPINGMGGAVQTLNSLGEKTPAVDWE